MRRILVAIPRHLALWVLVGASLAFAYPAAFAWTGRAARSFLPDFAAGSAPSPASSVYDLAGQPLASWMFALTMFAVGTVVDAGSFVSLARRPLAILLGLLTQFTVMPALAWLTAKLGGFDDSVALGFIIVGCAPGAMTSNVLTYLARGDAAYSVTLTTFASILSVVLTPVLIAVLAAREMHITEATFWAQLWTIAWTVATPLVLGILLRLLTPRIRETYEAFSPVVATLAIVVICCFVIQGTRDHLGQAVTSLSILGGVVVINALGFVLGGALGVLYGFGRARRVTLSIEIGMQNAGMGVVLATTVFRDPAVAVPAALFTIWCILTAAGLIAVLERRRLKPTEEGG